MSEARADVHTAVRLFVGKGGVGKTTLAVKTALAEVDAGSRVLVVSVDQAHSLHDVAGSTPDTPRRRPTTATPGLDLLELDTLELVESGYASLSALMAMSGTGHEHGVRFGAVEPREIVGAPGVQELLGLLRVVELANENRWDTVIVDLPATADAMRMLQMPDLVCGYLERLWPQHDRVVAGTGTDPRLTVVVAMIERVVADAEAVRTVLLDHARTSVSLVLTAERVGVAEARRTLSAAALIGVRVDTLMVNKVLPELNSSSVGLVGAHPAVFWFEAWRSAQQDVLTEITALAAGVGVVSVEQTPHEPVGLGALAAVVSHVESESAPGSGITSPVVEHESGTGVDSIYRMSLSLPVVDSSTLELGRVEDDLIIGADGVRRRVRLASVLRRCSVAGADFESGTLVVRFRPDSSVWPA